MRMPSPYAANDNQILVERHFDKKTVPFTFIPDNFLFNPGDIENLSAFADKISSKSDAFINSALSKIADNHYREHQRINPGDDSTPDAFRTGLTLQSVTIWPDRSWAMVFQSNSGILNNNVVYASFPANGSSFTSLIAK
jgi:hypothetical protein